MRDNPGLCGTNPGHALLEGVRRVRTLDMYIQEGVVDLLLRGGR